MKFAFIREHLQEYPVCSCCRGLKVSRSGYYAWLGRPVSRRQQRREELTAEIRRAMKPTTRR